MGLGCSAESSGDELADRDAPEATATAEEAIIGGTAVDVATRRSLGLINVNGGCSGSLINPDWVITASHCLNFVTPSANTFAAPRTDSGVDTRAAVNTIRLGGSDVAVVQLAAATSTMMWPNVSRTVDSGAVSNLVGKSVTCYGRGNTTYASPSGLTGFGDWRTLTKTVKSIASDNSLVIEATSSGSEVTAPGDSGGGCFYNGRTVAVVSWGSWTCADTTTGDKCKATITKVTGGGWRSTSEFASYINQMPTIMPTMPGTMQVVASNGTGSLVHFQRLPDGGWSGYGNVESQTGDIGIPVQTKIQTNRSGEAHVLARNQSNKLYHALRTANGVWTKFGDVGAVTGFAGSVTDMGLADVRDEMHVLAVSGGGLYHSILNNAYTWTAFGNVEGAAGDIGTITKVSPAGDSSGNLHVCALNSSNQLYHSIRYANGTWSAFGLVTDDATQNVSCTVIGSQLHVTRVRAATAGYGVEHRIRYADGSWIGWGNVDAATGTTLKLEIVSTSEVNGDLHIIGEKSGRLYHAVRTTSSGGWTSFNDLSGYAGLPASLYYFDAD